VAVLTHENDHEPPDDGPSTPESRADFSRYMADMRAKHAAEGRTDVLERMIRLRLDRHKLIYTMRATAEALSAAGFSSLAGHLLKTIAEVEA
jgi:hypothetical protein